MDWLKDKKNQPIVALILAVVIVGAAFFVWRMMSPGGSPEAPTAEAPGAEETAAPTGVPPTETPGAPGAPALETPAAGAAEQRPSAPESEQVAVRPIETWRDDPFLPVGYKPPPKSQRKPKPRIQDFPFPRLPVRLPKDEEEVLGPEPVQPTRRMAGILLNDRVYAIIESNGQSQIVQPGDVLSDRLARVEKIEADKVTLKTLTAKPRYLVVRMASSPRAASATPAAETTRPTMRGPLGMPPRGAPMPTPMLPTPPM